jgi:DNA repair exonuclease SbcCD ATPase subunit
MKAVRLTIKNVGIIENTVIELDRPLILFYGDLQQGKTTILNAFKWCLGGTFPTDVIRHGEKEASVIFEFREEDGPGSISRSWYINKEGATTARPVSFIRSGKPVSKPDNEIRKFLNPYLLDNNFLKEMSETDRKTYFVKLFGVDTSDIDKEIDTAADQAKTLRIEIKAFGEIDTTEVKPIDTTALRTEKESIADDYASALRKHKEAVESIESAYRQKCDTIAAANREIASHNDTRKRGIGQLTELDKSIKDLETRLSEAKEKHKKITDWLKVNPEKNETPIPARPVLPLPPDTPDISKIDAQLSEAAAIAVRVEQYQKNLTRAQDKAKKEMSLKALEDKQRDSKRKKVSRLAESGEKSGIEGLIFSEDGSFSYTGTAAGMLSTSQIMDLSQELSALYPSGFGLDLIDRAESLGFAIGKNILEFVEKAKREDKTILAAIVGERPATAPPEVGVFVVSEGKVS